MASITVTRPDLFPAGTSVAAYELTVFGVPASGAPSGDAVETESVAGDGTLTLDALDADTSYILYAEEPDRYLRVNTSESSSGAGGGDVDTSVIKAAVLHSDVSGTGSGYPARPEGYASVEWIGPDDPVSVAEDGDTWVPTEAP